MGIKAKSKKAAAGATVALATAGLSSCNDNGAVDPPPPPLECNRVGDGQSLTATATVVGTELRVTISNSSFSTWSAAEITSVTGGTVRPIASRQPLTVVIDLADDTVRSGSFTLRGTLMGFAGTPQCTVLRTFTFRLAPDGVIVGSAAELPLSALQQARIALASRDGREVELEATTPFLGPRTVTWSVTGGEIVAREGSGLRWRLPAQAGLYQAELVIDYGSFGLSVDTLVLEVS